jgi:hypothetical protein
MLTVPGCAGVTTVRPHAEPGIVGNVYSSDAFQAVAGRKYMISLTEMPLAQSLLVTGTSRTTWFQTSHEAVQPS